MINRYTNYNKKLKFRKNVLKNEILLFCIIIVHINDEMW